jgi:hypothetical protein
MSVPQNSFSPQNLNYNQVPYIPWKGKTFTQITSSIQKNGQLFPTVAISQLISNPYPLQNIRRPLPLKIYRREIATAPLTNCNPRISGSIDVFDRPGGSLVNTAYINNSTEGIINTLDINYVNNSTEHPGSCSSMTTKGVCLDPATNALKRVRSSGMVRKTVVFGKIPEPYCTNSYQYLATRGKTFNQNQYNFLRAGNSTAKPGTNAAATNEYAVNTGINYCSDPSSNFIPTYYKPNNPQFAQQGGVSSSSYIARVKYDTITNNGALYTKAYGSAVGNALAYTGSPDGYTLKNKIGFPNTCCPIIPPNYNGGPDPAIRKCNVPLSGVIHESVGIQN